MFDRDHLMFSEKPQSADESEPEMILVEPIRRGRETSEWQGTCVVGVVIMGVLLLHLCGVQELPDAAVTALCWGISGITAAYTLGRSIVKRGIVDVPRVEVGAGDGLRPGEMRRLMDADAHPLYQRFQAKNAGPPTGGVPCGNEREARASARYSNPTPK